MIKMCNGLKFRDGHIYVNVHNKQLQYSDLQYQRLHCYLKSSYHYLFTPGFDCNDSDIRLVNGSNVHEGVVVICFDGVWGTVCASGLDDLTASVICRWLGFPHPGTHQ